MWDELLVPAGAGIAAGLGVAMPLGAIGALLLREGLVNGRRVAVAAAAGVAAVDTAYSAVATLTGAAAAALVEGHSGLFLILSGALVVTIGVRQLLAALRQRRIDTPEVEPTTAWRAFLRFIGLTAVNPLTLVYFIALAGAITTDSASALAPVVFVIAAGLSSLAWQLILATTGTLFGRSLKSGATEIVGIVASVLVVGLGTGIVVGGISPVVGGISPK